MICGIIISSVSNLILEKTYTFSLGLSDKEKVILNEEIFNKLNIKMKEKEREFGFEIEPVIASTFKTNLQLNPP